MSHYRRSRMGGATYFFTVVTYRRQPLLTRPEAMDALREAFRSVQHAHPFEMDAVVILPDHLHALCTLPAGDEDFSRRWAMIKRLVSRAVGHLAAPVATPSMKTRHESGFWQRRFWEHLIRDDNDFARHMDYIHFNAVKHGHAGRPADWPHSSFRKCVERGIYPADWASGVEIEGEFGE
ncbi:MAG: transposase [Thiobacillus sp.]|nr:transposase [Thiobacillus sp.]